MIVISVNCFWSAYRRFGLHKPVVTDITVASSSSGVERDGEMVIFCDNLLSSFGAHPSRRCALTTLAGLNTGARVNRDSQMSDAFILMINYKECRTRMEQRSKLAVSSFA